MTFVFVNKKGSGIKIAWEDIERIEKLYDPSQYQVVHYVPREGRGKRVIMSHFTELRRVES